MRLKEWTYGGRHIEPNDTWNKWTIKRMSDGVAVAQFPTKKMCRKHINAMKGAK